MVCALFLDKYLKNFVLAACELFDIPVKSAADDSFDVPRECSCVVCDMEAYKKYAAEIEKLPANLPDNSPDSDGIKIIVVGYPVDLIRLRAALKKAELGVKFEPISPIIRETIEYLRDERKICLRDTSVILTEQESRLFECLYENSGTYIPRDELCQIAWGREYAQTNAVDVYISYLRRKTENILGSAAIVSRRGKGYMLSPETADLICVKN